MNGAQRLWWRQSCSDHLMFVHPRGPLVGAQECHLLHYLQMATEKLSKAYLWRAGHAPPKSHTGYVRFLKALLDRRPEELDDIALALGFKHRNDLDAWVRNVQPLAYELQNIAPAEAHDKALFSTVSRKLVPIWSSENREKKGPATKNWAL